MIKTCCKTYNFALSNKTKDLLQDCFLNKGNNIINKKKNSFKNKKV